MTPKSAMEMTFRNEVLKLASEMPFAQKLINSGRLSVPCALTGSALHSASEGRINDGVTVVDAPLDGNGWLIHHLQGQITLLGIGDVTIPEIDGVRRIGINHINEEYPCFRAKDDLLTLRYGEHVIYLIRPDGHIAASFLNADQEKLKTAIRRMMGHG